MSPVRLENGHLLVPMRAEGAGGLVGDGMVEIGPDHPDFDVWDRFARELEAEAASRRAPQVPPTDEGSG